MNEHDNTAPEAQHAADEAESDRLFYEVAGEGDGEPVHPSHGDSKDTGGDDLEDAGSGGAPRDEKGRFAPADDDQGDQDDDQGGDDSGEQETADQELERLRQEAQQWQHRYQSDLGRQNALQRKIQQIEDENRQLKQQRPAGQSKKEAAASGDNPEGSGMSDAEWQAIKEDFPDIAKGIEHQLGRVTQQYESRIQQLEAQLTPIQQQAYEQSVQSELKTLGERHPDYAEYATPEGVPFDQLGEKAQRFNAWLSRQPEPVRQMMQSNSAADAAYLLDSFKRDTGAGQQQSDADQRQRRNQRRLQSAQSVPSRGGRQRSDIPDSDEDALFDYYAEKVDQ